MVTPTTRSQGTTIPVNWSTPESIKKMAGKKAEEGSKRKVEEPTSKSGSSSEEEEYEDLANTNSSSSESEGTETPSQLDPVEDPEPSPAFRIKRPTTRSTFGRPQARPKYKAFKKKTARPNSSSRKKPGG